MAGAADEKKEPFIISHLPANFQRAHAPLVMVAMVISLRHKAIFGGRAAAANGSSQRLLGGGALINGGPRRRPGSAKRVRDRFGPAAVFPTLLKLKLPGRRDLRFTAAALIKGWDCAAEGSGVPRSPRRPHLSPQAETRGRFHGDRRVHVRWRRHECSPGRDF